MGMNDETLTDNKRLKLPPETRVKGICSISGNNSSQFLAILSTFSKSSGLDHHVFLPSSNMITASCTLNYLDFDSQQIENKQSQDDSKKSLQQPTAKSESKEHRLQEPLQGLTNKGDEESLKSLMRDCIFALRKEGSEISPIAVKSNNDTASDLVETLGALDSLFESCKVTEDQNNLEIKNNSACERMMQSVLDNKQKRGPIDLVALIQGRGEGDGGGRASDDEKCGGDITNKSLLGVSTYSDNQSASPRGNQEELDPSASTKSEISSLVSLDRRLAALETRLANRVAGQRSSADVIANMEARIGRIERLVDLICCDS